MQALSHIFFAMISKMEPRELLQLLMDRDELNSSSLAVRINHATTQPQIHKFLSGKAKEPKRSTLAPIAMHFRIPLDALYDSATAEEIAKQKKLVGLEGLPPVPDGGEKDESTQKYSRNAIALALMYDNLPNDDALRTRRMRAAIDALLGLERPKGSQQKVAVPHVESKEKRHA